MEEVIQEIKNKVGNDPTKLFQEGMELLKYGQFETAIAIFEELKNDYRNTAAILDALGLAYFMKEGHESKNAKENLMEAKRIAPDNQQIQENLNYLLNNHQ